MGAHNFETYGEGTDPEKVYRDLVEQALFEAGHDPYNGTISTTGGWRYHQRNPVSLEEAYEIAANSLDQYQKWEACGAIPIGESSTSGERTVSLEVVIPGPGEFRERKPDIATAVAAAVRLRAGEELITWSVPQQRYEGGKMVGPKPEVKRKVTVEATEGKTETRYEVTGPGVPRRAWEQMHPTQAAARASLTEWLNAGNGYAKSPGNNPADYEVVGITRRVSGEPVVRGYAEIVSTKYPISATVGKVTRSGGVKGFLFFGWAAS